MALLDDGDMVGAVFMVDRDRISDAFDITVVS